MGHDNALLMLAIESILADRAGISQFLDDLSPPPAAPAGWSWAAYAATLDPSAPYPSRLPCDPQPDPRRRPPPWMGRIRRGESRGGTRFVLARVGGVRAFASCESPSAGARVLVDAKRNHRAMSDEVIRRE
jgi:hypothetical protein